MGDVLFVYLLVGACVGLLAGLFGIGGGLIFVPVLLYLFERDGISVAVSMHLAVGTSLATIVLSGTASAWAHHRRGAVLWPIARRLGPALVLGSAVGAALADALSSGVLKTVFGLFVLGVSLQMALELRPVARARGPGAAALWAGGGAIGGISALVGIGGGTLTTPFLLRYATPIHNAVATAAACGVPIALSGALAFVALGWGAAGLPPDSSGYVHWPAVAGLAAGSVVSAPLGARAAHRLRPRVLRCAFAVVLALVGVRMITS